MLISLYFFTHKVSAKPSLQRRVYIIYFIFHTSVICLRLSLNDLPSYVNKDVLERLSLAFNSIKARFPSSVQMN